MVLSLSASSASRVVRALSQWTRGRAMRWPSMDRARPPPGQDVRSSDTLPISIVDLSSSSDYCLRYDLGYIYRIATVFRVMMR